MKKNTVKTLMITGMMGFTNLVQADYPSNGNAKNVQPKNLTRMTENGSKDASFGQDILIDGGLVAWLNTKVGKRKLQIPVDIISNPLGIGNSYFLRAGNTEIEIKLDTGAMSMNLGMHLKSYCVSFPCRVWLEGTWGPLLSVGSPQGILPIFAVRKVVGVANKSEITVRFPKVMTE